LNNKENNNEVEPEKSIKEMFEKVTENFIIEHGLDIEQYKILVEKFKQDLREATDVQR
jgi:hypothetical protein